VNNTVSTLPRQLDHDYNNLTSIWREI
jgi:hypothetical protein